MSTRRMVFIEHPKKIQNSTTEFWPKVRYNSALCVIPQIKCTEFAVLENKEYLNAES